MNTFWTATLGSLSRLVHSDPLDIITSSMGADHVSQPSRKRRFNDTYNFRAFACAQHCAALADNYGPADPPLARRT